MRLNFKTLAGRSFSIAFDDDLDDELTVRYAKEAIEKQESIPDFRITLVFEGTKLLEETTPLEEYDVLSGGSDLPATRTRHAPLTPHPLLVGVRGYAAAAHRHEQKAAAKEPAPGQGCRQAIAAPSRAAGCCDTRLACDRRCRPTGAHN